MAAAPAHQETHSHTFTLQSNSNLGFSMLPKVTLTCSPEEPGIGDRFTNIIISHIDFTTKHRVHFCEDRERKRERERERERER